MQPLDQNSMIPFMLINILGLHNAWCQLFLCRLWWVWLKCETTGASQRNRAFITMPAHLSVELNAHNLLYLVLLVQQKDLPPHALDVHLFNSQSCESIFRNTRALSGVYSTIINFSVHDFLRRSKRLSILNEIKCQQLHDETTNSLIFPVHHKHRKTRGPSTTLTQNDIDQLDVENIIIYAYNKAVHMLDGLDVLDSLRRRGLLEINSLSEFFSRQWNSNSRTHDNSSQPLSKVSDMFETGDDDDDESEEAEDINEHSDDEELNSPFNTTSEEEEDDKEQIKSIRTDFSGIKLFDTIKPHLRKSYFEVQLNSETKYLHKQSACWLLTDNHSRLSNDRLSRVMQMSDKQ